MQHLTTQDIMTTKTKLSLSPGLHVAIISDGNGRWATSRGLPRSAGHRAGAESARRIIEAAPRLGIHTLTLFALSSANWKRPAAEVNAILRLLHEYLLVETSHCIEEGVRLSVIGRRDRIPATLRQAIVDSEAATANGTRLHLRLAIDYSAREAIYHAACRFYKVTELSPESFSNVLAEVLRGGSTEVDLLIRTGGEQRLSDFLLWECAFAEFVFLAETLARFQRGRPRIRRARIRQARANPWSPARRDRRINSVEEGLINGRKYASFRAHCRAAISWSHLRHCRESPDFALRSGTPFQAIRNIGRLAALSGISSYLLVLCGVSLVSSKKVLPPGGWKYFCELDCHIAYSVSGVAATAAIGPDLQPTPAQGQFVIVRLKTWFDQRTISPHRGDSPLTPNARRVVLLDTNGHGYAEFPAGEAAIARTQDEAGSL